jgi:hypothetical protein
MSAPKDLHGVVAQSCECAPEEIDEVFSLGLPALRGSLKKSSFYFTARWCIKEALKRYDPVFRDMRLTDLELIPF